MASRRAPVGSPDRQPLGHIAPPRPLRAATAALLQLRRIRSEISRDGELLFGRRHGEEAVGHSQVKDKAAHTKARQKNYVHEPPRKFLSRCHII